MSEDIKMTENQKLLWERLEEFEIDDPNSDYTFSMRLAQENLWDISYALDVINEYKRFLFLACTVEHPVTPSDQVDQAWHLHLIYTKSYWVFLCKEILKREIHHGPTPGGKKAGENYTDFYNQTLVSYRLIFNEEPPKDIWPNTERRFSEIHFRRINIKRNWIFKKIWIK